MSVSTIEYLYLNYEANNAWYNLCTCVKMKEFKQATWTETCQHMICGLEVINYDHEQEIFLSAICDLEQELRLMACTMALFTLVGVVECWWKCQF